MHTWGCCLLLALWRGLCILLGRENNGNMRESHMKLEGFIMNYSVDEEVWSGGSVQEGRREKVMN